MNVNDNAVIQDIGVIVVLHREQARSYRGGGAVLFFGMFEERLFMANSTVLLPPPDIDGLLPDKPGGETNLLPEALTRVDLKVWFTVPEYSDPTLGEETVELFVGNNPSPVAVRTWTQPITDTDRYVLLPQQWLRTNDGQHSLRYRAKIYNGTEQDSSDLIVTLDTLAPILATASALVFPPAVLPPNKVTALYLEQNGDVLAAQLPAYTSPRPWDTIQWFWGKSVGDLTPGGTVKLTDQDYSDPIVVTIDGQFIRDDGDGARFVQYLVRDRAGNESLVSRHVELAIDARPIPRTLPWPEVDNTSGTGLQVTLDPANATNGAVVEIRADAVINPGEKVRLQWGAPGTFGAVETQTPTSPGGRRYAITKASVAAFIGKTLPVKYFVEDAAGDEFASDERQVKVLVPPVSGFPTVQCQGRSTGDLSYAQVPDEGGAITLATWRMMTTDQHIRIVMTGLLSTGYESQHNVILPRALTPTEVVSGIRNVVVPKAFLNRLMRNSTLSGKVYVSWDGGKTWPLEEAPNFPMLRMTLVD